MNMYKTLIVLLAVSLAGTLVHAQDSGVTVTTLGDQTPSTKNRNVVIVNQTTGPSSASDYQKQPTTVVEAAPLTNSHADEMRKSREATEVETEQRIVEKLEQSRIEDEKRRQQKILGTISGNEEKREEKREEKKDEVAATVPTQVIVVSPAPAPVAPPPAPVVIEQQAPAPAPVYAPAPPPEELHNAVRADLSEFNEHKDEKKYYFGGSVGQINYHQSNINSFGAVFLSLGERLPSNWNLSVDLGYANSNVDQGVFLFQKLDQYSAGMTAKYEFLSGKVRPSVGGTIDYVRRQYSGLQTQYGTVSAYNGSSLDSLASNAVDVGAVAAVDVAVSESLTIGLEYKYMTNLGYKYDGNSSILNSASYPSSTLLETQNYDYWSFVVRWVF